ncbi:hydroxymethylglutaryl-CoA reductase, degradative [Saprospiraceae bacterium]|nr:hydroxymethylglutaryl-CoA reductase, degradative [Saprospiraceae bacterium]MDA9873005.1 hydroxymethylglutaryl-CoA reductase, degradative [Saprospiraceae bacterium]MDC1508708.1 hydroxymethylglutaryl-CoA reductase, degradative [Saprospiraceae bacterium]|tara:strand:+ start:791 stop:2122 length:1332 start_codon:yes stop_codon:yes gene_type:complete
MDHKTTNDQKIISGFSKLSKVGKLKWLAENFFKDPQSTIEELRSYWHSDDDQQKILDGFSENTISNFPMPFGVAPNFLIDGKPYAVPMVIEESSVVAAASMAAKYWMSRGGFKTTILGTIKIGQVHFKWFGGKELLIKIFPQIKADLIQEAKSITSNMDKRGGGILDIELLDFTEKEDGLYQLRCSFETCDSMGANFINSVLEQFGKSLQTFIFNHPSTSGQSNQLMVIMCILSNFTPDCLVRAEVSCPISELGTMGFDLDAEALAYKFWTAIRIAEIDPYRATTHNKGIFNGIDAVVLATGNDFRAIEACGHAYAAKDGQYKSLSHCSIEDDVFRFWIDMPLAVGTVGGLTNLHPIAKKSLELLGNPTAEELMKVIAVTGLAQNFAAIRSLITTGIQSGHMKMHLVNILHQLKARDNEIENAVEHFSDKVVSFSAVRDFLEA